MSDAHIVARDQLRSFIERIERLEAEKQTIADDIKDVYGEAKATGFDAKILRKVISIRKQDADERAEQEAILDTYLQALGMIQMDMFDEPEPETSPKLVATVATAMKAQAGRAALLTAVDIMIEREARIDPTTGEILDDAPRADGGLDIVTKHTEIASASQGEAEVPSDQREFDREAAATGVGANEGGEDVEGGALRADHSDQEELEPSGPDVNGHPISPEEANEACRASQDAAPVTGRPAEPMNSLPTEGCGYAHTEGNATQSGVTGGETPPSFLTKPPSPLRPHCQRPEMCAGVGRTHCHTCTKAMREQEELA
jgi:uncharacterized protein (UPF0335 family)